MSAATRATKPDRAYIRLNDRFRDVLTEAVRAKFGIEVEHEYAFLAGRLITTRTDGADFTPEQLAFIGAYSDGYTAAMQELSNA